MEKKKGNNQNKVNINNNNLNKVGNNSNNIVKTDNSYQNDLNNKKQQRNNSNRSKSNKNNLNRNNPNRDNSNKNNQNKINLNKNNPNKITQKSVNTNNNQNKINSNMNNQNKNNQNKNNQNKNNQNRSNSNKNSANITKNGDLPKNKIQNNGKQNIQKNKNYSNIKSKNYQKTNEENDNNVSNNLDEKKKKTNNNALNQKNSNRVVDNTKKVDDNIEKENTKEKKSKALLIVVLILITIILAIIGMFVLNLFGNKINSNIYIENIDVSNMDFYTAKEKVENNYENILGKDIKYTYNDKEYVINLDDIDFTILVDDAITKAKNVGRSSDLIVAAKDYYELKLGKVKNIDLEYEYNKEKLYSKIKEIENDFYREVKQYTYSVDGISLKITNGSVGVRIEYEKFENELLSAIDNKNISKVFEIPIFIEQPDEIDIEKIHSEVYVKVANAYYETEPFKIYNEVKGVDFDKNKLTEMISLEPEKEEYVIDLQFTEPEVKVGDLGLYNDVLGECKTAYVNNPNRTVNLRLAASKIDGKILMPGESFSYNDVVGERTVAAGYRNAAIYINGEVEDGLAGGICQISSTLYDAVVYSNLEVNERHNHARVPSYVSAGKDATVYWGSKDFKFTNNRSYPIKISLTVNGGYAHAVIYGMKTDNEYEISFATSVVSRYNGYMVVKTYKVYKQNGVEVKRELISTDSYKV